MKASKTIKFSTLAVAGVCIGLMAVGCGDSGDSSPAPAGKSLSATYEYKAAPSARSFIDTNIVGVKYDFLNSAGNFVSDTDFIAIAHTTATKDININVPNLKEGTESSVAYFFNNDDEIVALGYDILSFDGNGKATVAEPVVDTEYALHLTNMVATASPAHIDIHETSQVSVNADYQVGDKKYTIDLTRSGKYTSEDMDIISADAANFGLFTGKAYGQATVTFTPSFSMPASFVLPTCTIDVTDAELTGVQIRYGENENTELGFLLPNYNFNVGKVIAKDEDNNYTDQATAMYLVGLYTTETKGASNYEEELSQGVNWSLEGVDTVEPEFVAVPGEDGTYTVTAKKVTTKPSAVKAAYALPGASAFTSTLNISAYKAWAGVSFDMDSKTIGGQQYPTVLKDIPQGSTTSWIVHPQGAYAFKSQNSIDMNVVKIVKDRFTVTTDEANVPGVTCQLNAAGTAYELTVPIYEKGTEKTPTAYNVTTNVKLAEEEPSYSTTWHAFVPES